MTDMFKSLERNHDSNVHHCQKEFSIMTKETALTIASILASIGVVIVGVVLTSSTAFGQGNTTTTWWHDPKYLSQIQSSPSYEPSNFTELWQANQPKDAIEAQSDGEMKKFENSKMGLSFQIPSEWNLTSSEPTDCEV